VRLPGRIAKLEGQRRATAGVSPEILAWRRRNADTAAWWHAAPPAVQGYFGAIIAAHGPWAGDEDAATVRQRTSERARDAHPHFWHVGRCIHERHTWKAWATVPLWVAQAELLDMARRRLISRIALAECNHRIDGEAEVRADRRMYGTGYDHAALEREAGHLSDAPLCLWRERGTDDPDTLAPMGLGDAELALLAAYEDEGGEGDATTHTA